MTPNKTVKFIHTADWHIGNTFSSFKPEMRKELKKAIFTTVRMIFSRAQKNQVPLILCAGDTVDSGQACSKEELLELFGIIEKYPDIRVVMITGNHDPLGVQNVYRRVEKENYPPNLYLVKRDEEIDYPKWNLTIWPASIRAKNGNYNPIEWIKAREIDKTRINIGLCHGSIKNDAFSGNDFPIESDFAQKQGLDYLALGDWHTYKKINERTFYPGVPEPLKFKDDGYPLLVSIDAPGAVPVVKRITDVRTHQWKQIEKKINSKTLNELKTILDNRVDWEIRQITVTGTLPIKEYKSYEELLVKNQNPNTIIRDQVTIYPGDPAFLETLDGFMKTVAQRLMELKETDEPLPEDILNPYVSVERTEVHRQSDELQSSRQEVIDNALKRLYTYHEEKG